MKSTLLVTSLALVLATPRVDAKPPACSAIAKQFAAADREWEAALRAADLVSATSAPLTMGLFEPGPTPRGPTAEQKRLAAYFATKRTGDLVEYQVHGKAYRGIYVDTAGVARWSLVRRRDQVFVALTRSAREIECVSDTTGMARACRGGAPARWVHALPAGTRVGGAIELRVVALHARPTGLPQGSCRS